MNPQDNEKTTSNLHIWSFTGDIEKIRQMKFIESDLNKIDEYGRTALHLACYKNHIDIAKLLINSGASVNVTDSNFTTPLHWAAYNGNEDLMKFLIERNAKIQAKDKNGIPAIHLAALRGHTSLVCLLLDEYLSECTRDNCGITPLHLAAYCGHDEVVKVLLPFGVNGDYNGITPLMLATSSNHTSTLRLLLCNTFKFHLRDSDNFGLLATHWAVVCGNNELVDLFERQHLLTHMTCRADSLVFLATKYGHDETVSLLLKAGYNLILEDGNSDTYIHLMNLEGPDGVINKDRDLLNLPNALCWAAAFCSKHIVEQFVANGLNCDKGDSSADNTPLVFAAAYGNCEVIQYLIDLGCNINQYRPIHWAAAHGHFDATKLLLQNGADNSGSLLWAAASGHLDTVKLLVKNGANVNEYFEIKDLHKYFDELTEYPILCAARLGHADMIVYLLNNGADINTPDVIHWCATNNLIEPIQILLDRGVEIDNVDRCFNRTALHWAVKSGHVKLVEFLLDRGAFVNAVEVQGDLPIHYGVQDGNTEMIKLLVERGANVNTWGYTGFPLCLAVKNGKLENVKLLVESGADVNFTEDDPTHDSPISLAMKFKHKDIAKYLIEKGVSTTFLHKVAECGDISDLMEAFNLIGNPNTLDEKGRTPIFFAVRCSSYENTRFLIKHGANVNHMDLDGETALNVAVQCTSCKDRMESLMYSDVNFNFRSFCNGTFMCSICSIARIRTPLDYPREKTLYELLLAGADVNVADKLGLAPIHYAVNVKSVKMLNMLIEYEANLNVLMWDTYTPLGHAVAKKWDDGVKLLIVHGADVNCLNERLIIDIWGWYYMLEHKELEEIIKILILAGLDLNMCLSCIDKLPGHMQNIIRHFEMHSFTLQQLSRIACRKAFGKNYVKVVNTQLCLPYSVKKYLLFESL